MSRASTVFWLIVLPAVLLVSAPLVRDAASQSNEDCFMCHSEEGGASVVDVAPLRGSAHEHVDCASCHSDAAELPHPEELSPVRCQSCHGSTARQYLSGRHGKKVGGDRPEAEICGDCHGQPHAVLPTSDPSSPAYRAVIPQLCARCHDDPERMKSAMLTEAEPYVSYLESVHGRAHEEGVESAPICTDCHGAHSLLPSSDPNSRIFRLHVPETCGQCHSDIAATLEQSVHGVALAAGIEDSPVCTDCHGEHRIRSHEEPASSVYPTSIVKTCGACHEAERISTKFRIPGDRISTYQESYHGLAGRYGSITVANCASCHGYHDILPSSDPASTVHKANLPRTCGKCHVGAGAGLAEGYVHSTALRSKTPIVHYVAVIYIVLICLIVGGMFFHNLLDFMKKLLVHFRETKERERVFRFVFVERLQHILLAITFITLAYTGFAIKFPEAWWATPFRLFSEPDGVRRLIHRIAAWIFIGLCVYHAWFIMLTRRDREQLRELAPRVRDFKDLWALLRFNLGFSRERPTFRRFNYIEKSEYWALIWGSVIMVLSGLLLVFENFTLKYFPLWVSELATVVHLYEAILASLAIVVWHFYWTIFEPDSYPMNWSWITGRITDKQLEEREEIGEDKERGAVERGSGEHAVKK
ncbi:MAG: cytochrome b/b6 domain-containing protein [Candidatus Eiseniibacteriota bacterium]|nr:MAG: cytochrome b/b6 domain-containing protein [Candidatus Eisenbacteria bacterium]